MPVHLGSMGESVQDDHRRATRGTMQPGDVYVLNAPYNGGTHLPDVTVITPVFDDDGARARCSTSASRGHHADIGGITPGSMPPDSTHVDEEGVLLDNVQLVDATAASSRPRCARCCAPARYPARNVDQNLADLRAQVAACEKGVAGAARRWSRSSASTVVHAYMRHVQDNAEESVRRVIDVLKDGEFAYAMDNGAMIARRDPRSTRASAQRDDRLHRHQRAAAEQLQRAVGGDAWRPCSTCSARWSTTTSR